MWPITEERRQERVGRAGAAPSVMRARSDRPCRVAVVGAGFGGVLTVIHLLANCRPGERVYLIDDSGRTGHGPSYVASDPYRLLQTRAAEMSAFEDDPAHFQEWLARRGADREGTGRNTFVARGLYGDYLQHLLRQAAGLHSCGQSLRIVTDAAVALRPIIAGLDLETAQGRCYGIDAAVLAVGNATEGQLLDQLVEDGPTLAGRPAHGAEAVDGRWSRPLFKIDTRARDGSRSSIPLPEIRSQAERVALLALDAARMSAGEMFA